MYSLLDMITSSAQITQMLLGFQKLLQATWLDILRERFYCLELFNMPNRAEL